MMNSDCMNCTYKRVVVLILSALCICACNAEKPEEKRNAGVSIYTYLPTGTMYYDSLNIAHGYRCVVVGLENDTTVPAEVILNVPDSSLRLFQSNNGFCRVFILPDTMTKQMQYNGNEMSNELRGFIRDEKYDKGSIIIGIQPGEKRKVRFGFLLENIDGVFRAEVLSSGRKSLYNIPGADGLKILSTEHTCDLKLGWMVNATAYRIVDCGMVVYGEKGK